MKDKKKFLFFYIRLFFLFFILFCGLKRIYAADIVADYEVTYYINKNKDIITTNVIYSINFENLRSDIYVSKYNLAFPSLFKINNLSAFSNGEQLTPTILNEDRRIKIDFDLKNIKVGKGEKNNLLIKFDQENLFKENGNVWEVIIPSIESDNISTYKIFVNIPNIAEKKLTVAKPVPTKIYNIENRTVISWINPKTKIVYAVFGEKQFYQLSLTYNLHNPKPFPVFYEIALPPDTLYQKIYISSIEPKINNFYSDDDGNFIGKVLLLPNENKKIIFNGVMEIFVKPREEVKNVISDLFDNQKKYLLSANNYLWQINENSISRHISSPEQIYQTVINTLDYNYKKLDKKIERLGAQRAIINPQLAVCTEYTDLFIAIAKEKGIYAREIQGYGFSNDENLRPISLTSDVLHSWVEYFDLQKKIWIPIDPTWEDTSGIDYFNSLDFNHIAFVIHGKDPNYPYPAGMYKIEDSKDILIKAVSESPRKVGELDFDFILNQKNLYENTEYKTKIKITNNSNTYQWDIKISLKGENIIFPTKNYKIAYLVPFSSKELLIPFKTKSNFKIQSAKVRIDVNNLTNVYSFKILPIYFFYFKYIILISFIFFILFILFKYGVLNKKH